MAHTGSVKPKPRSSRLQYEASASERSPSVRAAPTKDLRAELNRRRAEGDAQVPLERPEDLQDKLNRRCAGKDACISLEKARERRGNLEQDFTAVAPRAPGDARFQTSIPLAGVGCVALADHLRAATWPPKFRSHLPEKYDDTTNPSEFLQVYVTVITAAGGGTTVMATYFHVALSGPARTWLMNQALGSIYSWEELYARFVANFASAYQGHGVEAHLHAVRQEPGETLRMFISRFTKVRGTIPRISDASIITAFRQGVRDEKMLEKLATHDMDNVTTLFALADKCVRAAEGRAWHSAPQAGVTQVGGSDVVTQGGGKKKKGNKNYGHEKPQFAVSVAAAAARAKASAASVHGPREAAVAHAQCTPIAATVPPTAVRLSNSRGASASGAISPPRTSRRPTAGQARRKRTKRSRLWRDETSAISRPRGTLRTFSPEILTPATMATIAISCM
jgi:hypothetical protein